MRSDADRLGDILEAIEKINARNTGDLDAFLGDEVLQVWVIHHLQRIGEAARGISKSLRDRCPEVPWPRIIALRNMLVHEYFGINLRQVWTMVQKDLLELEEHLRRARLRIASGGEGSG